MFSPLALVLIPAGYLFLWPLVDHIKHPDDSALKVSLTAIALSLGTLTVILFWLGMLPGRWLTGWSALAVMLIGWVAGLALHPGWFDPPGWRRYWQRQLRRLFVLDWNGLLLWTVIGALSITLIHTLYYPFIGDDTLSRYGLHAKMIYLEQRLPESVWGYPPLIPITFSATWFAAGSINEHLSKLVSVVAAVGVLGSTLLLARQASDDRKSLLAAGLLAVTPLFLRNASLDYTDIPTAFPMLLSVLYMLDWWKRQTAREALLAGALVAVAIFTKQSALTSLASLMGIVFFWFLYASHVPLKSRVRSAAVGLVSVLLPSLIIALPWYARNWLIGGWVNVVPIAGLYHLLEPNVGPIGFIPPLASPEEFGGSLLSLAYGIGWIIGLALALKDVVSMFRTGVRPWLPVNAFLAIVAIPYWLAWWTRFSFDARFLVIILPVIAIWTAFWIEEAIAWLLAQIRPPQMVARLVGAVILLTLLMIGSRDRWGGVYYALTRPFATEDERSRHVKGEVYDLALYIREHFEPGQDRIASMDGRLPYYVIEYDVDILYPLTLADLKDYDYLVHSSSIYSVYDDRMGWDRSEFYRYAWDSSVFEPVYESGGVHIMRILTTEIPAARGSTP